MRQHLGYGTEQRCGGNNAGLAGFAVLGPLRLVGIVKLRGMSGYGVWGLNKQEEEQEGKVRHE